MDVLRFSAPVELQAAADKPPRLRIVAYTGGLMQPAGWPLVVIDLAGLELPASVPVLADHDASLAGVVGPGVPRIERGKLLVEAAFGPGEKAERVRELLAAGVPLAASVGVEPLERRTLRDGETVEVNGRNIAAAGGSLLITRGRLREVSVVTVGADPAAKVALTAQHGGRSMSEDKVQQVADPVAEERRRVAALVAAGRGECPDLLEAAIREGWSVNDLKSAMLDRVRASRPAAPTLRPGGPAVDGTPRDVLAASCLRLIGRHDLAEKHYPHVRAERPSGFPELAATALRLHGQDVPSDRGELIRAAFGTTDMPTALGLSIEKLALETFADASQNWRAVARVVSTSSFRDSAALRLAMGSKFEPVPPDGELKFATLGEDAFTYKVGTYGRIVGIDRQSLVNDDAGLLADIPAVLGLEAARSVSDLFFETLASAGSSFFSVSKGNLLTGSSSALSLTALANAVKALRLMTDTDKRVLGLEPRVLLVPAALEATARALLNSVELARTGADNLPTGNPMQPLNLQLVVEPRLDAASVTTWYLVASPRYAPLIVGFLNGKDSPTVEAVEPPPSYLGQQWRAYLDFGVALGEHRAIIKSAGA